MYGEVEREEYAALIFSTFKLPVSTKDTL